MTTMLVPRKRFKLKVGDAYRVPGGRIGTIVAVDHFGGKDGTTGITFEVPELAIIAQDGGPSNETVLVEAPVTKTNVLAALAYYKVRVGALQWLLKRPGKLADRRHLGADLVAMGRGIQALGILVEEANDAPR